ncbi:uncharacterized protein [Oscarella lobularis]|uniref:uncharacterized protein isoform X3 n=1 Tax=Oscarella lobularis TaxID=121494 RepID=UPI003313FDD1
MRTRTLALCMLVGILEAVQGVQIVDYSPRSGPAVGGTLVRVEGNGFTVQEPHRSKCQFRTSSSSRLSPSTIVANSTDLVCSTPAVPFVTQVRFEITSGTIASPWRPFIFFDLTKIAVTGIKPSEGPLERDTDVLIYGRNFVDTGEIACMIDGVPEVQAEFLNSTVLRCRLVARTLRESLRVVLNVSLNAGDDTGIVPSAVDTQYIFYHRAPELISVSFTKSLGQLLIDFDTETVLASPDYHMDCRTILSDVSFLLVGASNATCSWANRQQRRIVIDLPREAQVKLGSDISIKAGVFATRYQIYSRYSEGGLAVSAPGDVALPVAVIEGPEVMTSLCKRATYTGQNSFSVGYSGLKYIWSVTSENKSLNHLVNGSLNDASVTLDYSAFLGFKTISLHLGVESSLGFLSNPTQFVVTLQNSSSPMVVILGPQSRRISCVEDHVFEAELVCRDETKPLSFLWQLISNDRGYSYTPKSWMNQTSRLLVDKGTFQCGFSYHLKITVGTAFSAVSIEADYPRLRARIRGGDERTLSVSQSFLLDGSESYDPANNVPQPHDENYEWQCTIENSTLPCKGVSFKNNSVVQLPAFALKAGDYLFQLNYSKGHRFSVAKTLIRLLPTIGQAPILTVISPLNSELINIRSKLIIQAWVASHNLEATVQWISLSASPGYGYVNLSDPNRVSTPHKYFINTEENFVSDAKENLKANRSMNRVDLVIQPNTLLPSTPYRFRLLVNTTLTSRYSDVIIRTLAVPTSCRLEISPPLGNALETDFKLKVQGCAVVEEQRPLWYQFGIEGEQGITWLRAPSLNNELSTVLTPGQPVLIRARIRDSNDVYVTLRNEVTVAKTVQFNLSNIQRSIQQKIDFDWPSALQKLLVSLMALNENSTGLQEAELASFRSFALSRANHLFDTVIPKERDYLVDVVNVIRSLTERANLDVAQEETASRLLSSSLQQTDVSISEGQSLMSAYSNILSSSSSEAATSEFFASMRRLGYGLCLGQGYGEVTESVVFRPLGVLGATVRRLENSQTIACEENFHSECPFIGSAKSDVNFRDSLSGLYDDPVCFVSAQLNVDLHPLQSEYAPVVKSSVVSLELIGLDAGQLLSVDNLQGKPIQIEIPLVIAGARNGSLECRYWNENEKKWAGDGCETVRPSGVSLLEGTQISCMCKHLSEFVIVQKCHAGYYGIYCERSCPQGRWGQDCLESCACNSRGPCDFVSGQCDCNSGWIGLQCERRCREGLWGKNCSLDCDCLNNALCDPHTGECLCQSGWVGPRCNQTCPSGYFGKGCRQNCTCVDDNTAKCNASTGECICRPGFKGEDCSRACDQGSYGFNCLSRCTCSLNGTELCDPVAGECKCSERWNGTTCSIYIPPPTAPPPAPFPVWVVALAVIIVLLVVSIILLYLWYRKKKRRKVAIHPQGRAHKLDYEDDGVTFTRAESMEFTLRRKKKPNEEDEVDKIIKDGQIGWKVARMKSLPPPREKKRSAAVKKASTDDQVQTEILDINEQVKPEEEEEEKAKTREPDVEFFPERIYLPPTATLAELREKLTGANWMTGKMSFRFLLRGDQRLFYSRDQEPVVILAQVFVDKDDYRAIHLWENPRHSAKRRRRKVSSARPKSRPSLRRKAIENASGASSLATLTSYTSYTGTSGSYTSYTSFSGSEFLDDSQVDNSEFSGSDSGSFVSSESDSGSGSDVDGSSVGVSARVSAKSTASDRKKSNLLVDEDLLVQTSLKESQDSVRGEPSDKRSSSELSKASAQEKADVEDREREENKHLEEEEQKKPEEEAKEADVDELEEGGRQETKNEDNTEHNQAGEQKEDTENEANEESGMTLAFCYLNHRVRHL